MSEKISNEKAVPPYPPFKTFVTFLDKLQESGVPGRIDRSYWHDFLSGSGGSLITSTLRFFNLTNEFDQPTEKLKEMIAHPEQRPNRIKELFEEGYQKILGEINIENSTFKQLTEAFDKNYDIGASVKDKTIRFFIQMAEYAQLRVSPHITNARKSTQTRKVAGKRNGNGQSDTASAAAKLRQTSNDSKQQSNNVVKSSNVKTIQLKSGGVLTLDLNANLFELQPEEQAFVLGLIEQIRKFEEQQSEGEAKVTN